MSTQPDRRIIAAYAAGSIGTGVFSTVPTVLLLYFCTETLELSPALTSTAILVPKLWSIVWDPLVGVWSDRSRTRWGRRPFLLLGALGVAGTFIALFAPPALTHAGLLAWVAASYLLLATAYSLFAVPYIALPAELTADERTRSHLVASRMTVAMVGVLLGAAAAPAIVQLAGGGRSGYATMAFVLSAVCLVAMLIPTLTVPSFPSHVQHRSEQHWLTGLGESLRAREFRNLAAAYLLQLAAVGIASAALPYLVTRSFGRAEGDIGIAMMTMLGSTALSIPLWSRIGLKRGEASSTVAAALGYAMAVAILGILALQSLSWGAALTTCALAGVAFGGLQVLPFTLLARVTHMESARRSSSIEATFAGVWTAAEKLGLALGPAIVGATLALSDQGARALPVLLSWAPALLLCSSLLLLPLRKPDAAALVRTVQR